MVTIYAFSSTLILARYKNSTVRRYKRENVVQYCDFVSIFFFTFFTVFAIIEGFFRFLFVVCCVETIDKLYIYLLFS